MVSEGIGYICSLVAVLFFGSNFVPVKRFETYDGMFYQWVMCSAIFMWGLMLQLVLMVTDDVFDMSHNSTNVSATDLIADANNRLLLSSKTDDYSVKFFPFAALGGALWSTGNTMSVPVINSIGLSMGLLIWGAANMLMGWATGAFGLFDLEKDDLSNPGLNYAGVSLAVVALGIYSQIKPSLSSQPAATGGLEPLQANGKPFADEETAPRDASGTMLAPEMPMDLAKPEDGQSAARRLGGVIMAIISGVLYGNNFTPPTYMQDKKQGPSKDDVLSYVFSHFTGIFAMSTVWFLVYCVVMKSNPRINPRLVIPGFISGIMWAIANTCWFIANNALDMSIAFPIITSGPGIISALWGVFVFGEIRGRRNYTMLGGSVLLSVTGCVMIAVSH